MKKIPKQLPENTKRPEVEMGKTYAQRVKEASDFQKGILAESKYIFRNGRPYLPIFSELGGNRYE